MQITMTPTPHVTRVNGQPVRAWKGTTSDGVNVAVFVAYIAVDDTADATAFERELLTLPPPAEMRLPDVLRQIL